MLWETRETGLTGRRRSGRSETRKESEEGRDGGGSGSSGEVKKHSQQPLLSLSQLFLLLSVMLLPSVVGEDSW